MPHSRRICFIPQIPGAAGPANFQRRLEGGLAARGIAVTYDPEDAPIDAVLVIGDSALPAFSGCSRDPFPALSGNRSSAQSHRPAPVSARRVKLCCAIRDRFARGLITRAPSAAAGERPARRRRGPW
jgi:hypothetical protein